MKTEYQYIRFDDYSNPKQKTGRWMCVNRTHGSFLGEVKWYPGWRQYCFEPVGHTVFSKVCLDDIGHFIRQLMDARKWG
jgi:hypothetical protein